MENVQHKVKRACLESILGEVQLSMENVQHKDKRACLESILGEVQRLVQSMSPLGMCPGGRDRCGTHVLGRGIHVLKRNRNCPSVYLMEMPLMVQHPPRLNCRRR
jgi:hypothetical protein